MKLSVVISVHNQIEMAKRLFAETVKNSSGNVDVEFIIIGNGGQPLVHSDFPLADRIINQENIGVYPTFKQGFEVATGDIVAFFHSDVVIWEKYWDVRVLNTFRNQPFLGLMGFIGSNEIDVHGGRGAGTMGNFIGDSVVAPMGIWKGSKMSDHGRTTNDYERGAVVDGCVMIIRRTAWEKIGYREDFPPHHFYDRLISTQMLEAGFHVGVLGVAFDHISGQTVNKEQGYQDMGKEWLDKNGFDSSNSKPIDERIYLIAETMWLNEYRDTKHIIPIRI